MTRRITKKRAKWQRPPRVAGTLTADGAGRALPRLIQRLKARNEVWIVVGANPAEGICCLLSPRYSAAASTIRETQATDAGEIGTDWGA